MIYSRIRGQSVIVSAYMATALIIVALFVVYSLLLPRMTVSTINYNYIDINKLVYSRPSWTAKELAEAIASEYNVKYVAVNITIVNLIDNNATYDYYSIKTVNAQNVMIYYTYNLTQLQPDGLLYMYNIKVGI